MTDLEIKAEMERRGFMVSLPFEGNPQSDVYESWGVCYGSHGGYALTLSGAMDEFLKCCDIGDWWRIDFGQGELAKDFIARMKSERGEEVENG